MTDETTRKEELTLDELVDNTQAAWTRFRNAQLYSFCSAAELLIRAQENPALFDVYCKRLSVSGREPETRVVELMLAVDPDGEAISRERRAEYGNCIGWFADRELCPETDPDKAVALAIEKGRITGIAQKYRDKKEAENPEIKATKQKGQATKARRQDAETKVRRAASAAMARQAQQDAALDEQPKVLKLTTSESVASIVAEAAPDRFRVLADELMAFFTDQHIGEYQEDPSFPAVRIMLDIRDIDGTQHIFGPIIHEELANLTVSFSHSSAAAVAADSRDIWAAL